jgi:predicted N-acetyltransferase YhbS
MEFRPARRSERDAVLDLLALWYNDREFFARYNHNDATFRDELCLVALDAGSIVATVQIFDRKINLAGKAVPMGGIGSVFTRDDYRHKRIASELMKLAIATMEREGFEVSLLFAERVTFYNQFGWKEQTRNFSLLANPTGLRTRDYTFDVFEVERDLRDVMRIHREYSGRFDVTAIRDEADWRANLQFAGNSPADPVGGCEEDFVVARHGADIVAYARATRFHGVPMVMEYGYAPAHLDAAMALFRHLAMRFASAANAMLVTHTAHDLGLERALVDAGCPVAHHPDNFYMWRVNLPEKLAARLARPGKAAAQYALAKFADPSSLFWTSDRF